MRPAIWQSVNPLVGDLAKTAPETVGLGEVDELDLGSFEPLEGWFWGLGRTPRWVF